MVRSICKFFRGNIYSALIYRIVVIYILFTLCRLAFFLFNSSYFPDVTFCRFFTIMVGGLKFDTTAIIYVNALYILGMIIPFKFRHNSIYQTVLFWIFIVTNSIALLANIADIPYYPFTFRRTTCIVFGQFKNEQNLVLLFFKFVVDYWYITILFFGLIASMVLLYRRKLQTQIHIEKPSLYYILNTLMLIAVLVLMVGGIRGGFRHSTRPITLSNAGEYVENPNETALVLNTPFALIRTINKNGLKKEQFFTPSELDSIYSPVHNPKNNKAFEPKNIVIFILESYSKEFVGALNRHNNIKGYTGYTPFLDSLIGESYVFENAFANGKKSIEALPSVIASIPGMEVPYVLSSYSSNTINSIASLLKPKGYHSAFFHGAPNGSMGFQAFMKLAKIDEYYGKDEYNNDADFDGMWGIWDEPFLQFYARTINSFKQPFCVSLFSVSSHHPFAIPRKYEGKLKKGPLPLHQCINYTDLSLRKFFATARKMPWFKNTIFVITADHASFPYYKECNDDVDHFAIPLIFYTPDGSLRGDDTTTVAQQTDIMPTLLDYLHYDKQYVAFGKDLFHPSVDNFAINFLNGNYQVFNNRQILQSDGKTVAGLFDYKTDRSLKHKLNNATVQSDLLRKTQAFMQQYNNRMIDNNLIVGKSDKSSKGR